MGGHYRSINGSISMTPLTIPNSGTRLNGLMSSLSPDAGDSREAPVLPDPDYSLRPGYVRDFLGVEVPLPKLSNAVQAKAVRQPGVDGAAAFELKYYHFSVIMNGPARLAFVTAMNYDASAPFRQTREGSDRWFYDPRLDKSLQAGNEFYTDNPLDRGHLVRRADAAWGRSADEARHANDDTFHFTNCSPQHEIFNQANKASREHLLLWGNLEEHVAAQASVGRQRLSIFSGPVFRSTDRPYRGLLLPKEFWKIIVYGKSGTEPQVGAVAFILSQEGLIANLPLEEFQVGPYRPFQVKIREIEARTKLDFGALRARDPLEGDAFESKFVPGSDAVALTTLDDIVI
jgi:endonuclease G, mitochondrial